MDTDTQENRIRILAYELWEKDGSPEGQADEYWDRARAMIDDQLTSAATSVDAVGVSQKPRDQASGGKSTDSKVEI